MKVENEKRKSWFSGWFRTAKESALETNKDEYEQLCEEIEAARAEWAIAQQHIDCVTEPELIDHAIYYLEAAERKYGYLLREAKKKYGEKVKQRQVEPSL